MKKRIMAIILCFTMVFTMTGYVGLGDYTQVYAESEDLYVDETVQILSDEEGVEETPGTGLSIYASLLSTTDTEEMYMLMLDYMNNDPEGLKALTADEIEGLSAHISILDPEFDDVDTQDLLDTLSILPNGGESLVGNPEILPKDGLTISANRDISETQITGTNTVWTFANNVTVNLKGTITVPNGKTLTINGPGTIKRNTTGVMFMISSGGKLVLNGVTIDGANLSSSETAIWVDGGTLNINNSTIKDINNTSAKGTNASRGGAIRFGREGYERTVSSTITNSTITNCRAANGSAIMLANNCKGAIVINNSTISGCRSTTTDWGGTIRTQGRFNASLTISSCIIEDNYSSANGGGIYWNACGTNASLTIMGTASNPTIIRGNSAGTQGGGLHLGGQNITIENTHVLNNSAPNGGGISMTPYDDGTEVSAGCSVTLGQGAKLEGNTASANGGGVYMRIYSADPKSDVTFAVNVNEGATIQNNAAANGGAFAVIQETGTKKYNAEVNVNGGTISGNKATTGNGGAFYITRNYKTADAKYTLNVNVAGGQIFNNTASANGGAIYLKDSASSAKVTMSGGLVGGANTATANRAANGGAVYIQGGSFNMTNGTMSNNIASVNGGAIYVTGGNFNMTNGTIGGADATKANTAVDGGAVYLSGGNFTMSGGAVSYNKATNNGGAAYIVGGKVTMNNGNITNNEAAVDGGALYVSGTNATQDYFVMSDGNISYNKATRDGGAVYVSNGTVRMTSGVISNNEAKNSNGGAFYVNGGNIWLGVNGCEYTDPNGNPTVNHTVNPTDKAHPQIIDNAAKDSGGGIAIMGEGNLTMYCGRVISNMAINPGRGLNVYMENGTFEYYKGNIGALSDPELVIVGGVLKDNSKDNPDAKITINYYRDNSVTVTDKSAQATNGSVINLPDGENYWDAPKINGVQYRFFGWTFNGNASDDTLVRNKNQYKPLGTPIIVQEGVGNEADSNPTDNNIHLYALWAPEQSKITYMGVTIVNGEYTSLPADEVAAMKEKADNPSTYDFSVGPQLDVVNDVKKDGYTFKGWYIYQDLNQNANWGFEPAFNADNSLNYAELEFVAAGTQIDFGSTNFGNVTLIAAFEPAFADLRIAKDGWDSRDANQTFIFRITGTPDDGGADIDMTVTIHGNGEVLIKDLPVGTYEVEEVKEWSWRYMTGEQSIKLDNPDVDKSLEFENKRFNPLWLSGDSFCDNLWNGANNSVIKRLFS